MYKDSKELAKKLAANDPSITKLELSNSGITTNFLKDIMPALDYNTKVTYLDLSCNNLNAEDFIEVRETLLRNQTIETLLIQGNNTDEKSGKILIDGLRENYTLIEFQLDKDKLDYDEDDDYDECMERNQNMKEEGNKTETNVPPRGTKVEVKEEKKPVKETKPIVKKTEKITNTSTTTGGSGGGFVKPALKSTNSKQVQNNTTTPTSTGGGGGFVKPALKSTNSPFKTTGNVNTSTEPVVKQTTSTKTTTTPITTTSNVWNYSGPCATEIKRIKVNDKYLSKMDLSKKKMSDDTAKELFEALETNRFLKKLQLNDNLLTDESINYIEKMFPLNTTLDTLELEGNKFTAKGIDHFCEALAKNWSLTDATISFDATDDQLDIIDDILDRNYDKIYEEEKAKKKQNEQKTVPTFKPYSKTNSFKSNIQTLEKKASFKSTKNVFASIQLKKTDNTPVKSTDVSAPTNTINWRDKLKTPKSEINKAVSPSTSNSNPFGKTVKEESSSKPNVEQKELHHLLKWVNGMLWHCDFKVENFTHSFRNGRAFCEIAHQIDDSVKYDPQKSGDENIKAAWDLFERMEIDTFLDAEDVGKEQKSMMLCIKMVRDYFRAHD